MGRAMIGGITEEDMRRGLARAGRRLHVPITRMVSRVVREEIAAARARRVAGTPEPVEPMPAAKQRALSILRDRAAGRNETVGHG